VNCSACEALIGSYRDGELTSREAALVKAHLASCAACRAVAARYDAVEATLVRLVDIEPRADFTIGVMAKIATLPAHARKPMRLWWIVAADVAVWLALGALTALGAIRWQSLVGGAGALGEKLLVGFGALYDLGQHYHVTSLLALGVGIEIAVIVLLVAVGRRFLPGMRAALAGVLS